jgi:hypothetical protein
VKLRRVKRCALLSGVRRSRVRVAASEVDGIVVVEIAVDGIAVVEIVEGETRLRVRLLADVSLGGGIRGWIRCGSGLLLVALGRVLRMTRWWI